MSWTIIKSQPDLDAALTKDGGELHFEASIRFSLTKGRWVIRAAIGFKASVEAWGNSSVVARGNSSVVARENSSVVARENSSVEAWENVFVRLFSALKIKASAHVAIMQHGTARSIDGGRVLEVNKPSTSAEWCDHYGVTVSNGIATLFKAVDDDYSTHRARVVDITYAPGAIPVAPDWDGGEEECGGGLHASPHPKMALEFNSSAKHFVACPVRLDDIVVHPDGKYPHKVKFKGCAAPTYEVDRNGNRVEASDE